MPTAQELYQAILKLIGLTEAASIESASEQDLLSEINEILNTIQALIVVDDIDTLTTAGRDPGMDALYRLLLRSSAGGKVLYTMRNAPTQSLANAIEVPGLDAQTELPEFVATFCRHYNVPEPDEAFVQGLLNTITERRPLAIEVLIGLRRTAGSYDLASQLFQSHEGDQVREYLFQREYNALPADNHARLLLAALALLGRPASFSELRSILRAEDQRLNDSIGQTLEMFFQTTTDTSGETMYSLGAATESFLRSISKGLNFYEQLQARVQYFKSPFLPPNRQMSQLEFDVMQLFRRQEFAQAAELLTRPEYPPAISQHPTFNMLKGRAFSHLIPPKYDDAREAFSFAAAHRSSDIQGYREWYWMEKGSGFSIFKAIDVCDHVLRLKRIAVSGRAEFYTKRGLALRDLAVSSFHVDPEKSIGHLTEALSSLLESVELYHVSATDRDHFAKTREQLQDTFRFMFICAARLLEVRRSDLIQLIFRFFDEEKARKHHFDALEVPAIDCIRIFAKPRNADESTPNRSFLQRLLGTLGTAFGLRFRDEGARARISTAAKEAIARLQTRSPMVAKGS